MSQKLQITLILSLLLILVVPVTFADDDVDRGTIQGLVYEDVNGDGQCVNTGIEGEAPLEGVNIEFVSSDEDTVINLTSGPEGIYGLFAVGHSYWRVTAKPGPDWVVTSESPLYAPVYPETQTHTDMNFCVSKATNAKIILPVSGQAANPLFAWAAFLGMGLIAAGVVVEWQRRA